VTEPDGKTELWTRLNIVLAALNGSVDGQAVVEKTVNGGPPHRTEYRVTGAGDGSGQLVTTTTEVVGAADSLLADHLARLRREEAPLATRRAALTELAGRFADAVSGALTSTDGPRPRDAEPADRRHPEEHALLTTEFSKLLADSQRQANRLQIVYLLAGLAASIPIGILINIVTSHWH
jgi:hypothetical protein